jgi:hypothetical protein
MCIEGRLFFLRCFGFSKKNTKGFLEVCPAEIQLATEI